MTKLVTSSVLGVFVGGLLVWFVGSSGIPKLLPIDSDVPSDGDVQVVSVPVDCPDSNITDLYDTPSGVIEAGYYDASGKVPDMSTTTYKAASKIGKRAYTICHDQKGNKFIIPLTFQEYDALALPNAGTPQKTVLEEIPIKP